MKTRFAKQVLALLLMLALVVPAVAFAEPATVALKLGVKEKYQIVGSTIPGAEGKTLIYASSNKKVATVSSSGVITARKKGTVGIAVGYDTTVLAVFQVTVLAAPKKVTLSEKKLLISKDDTKQLVATLPKKTASAIAFASSDPAVATVDALGNVKGVGSGKAVITAKTFNKKTAKCTVYVMAGPAPTSMALNAEAVTLYVKEKFQVTPTLNEGSDTLYAYSVKNKKVATVSSSGLITAKKKGTTTVTVTTHNGLTKTVQVTVKAKLTDVYGTLTSSPKNFVKYAKKLKLKKDNDPDFKGVMYYNSQLALIMTEDSCQVDLNPATKPKYSLQGVDVNMTLDEAKVKLIAKGWKEAGKSTVDGVDVYAFTNDSDANRGIAISTDDGKTIGGIVAVLKF